MAPSAEFYRAMRYLRLVQKNLERAEDMSHTLSPSSQRAEDTDDDDETSSLSSLSSISSSIHSRISSITALTTASDIIENASIAETDHYSDEDEPLDLRDSVIFIAQRVTCQRFSEEIEHAFKGTRLCFGQAIQKVWSRLNLKYCEISKKVHVFEQGRRCHLCSVQLCRDCEQCILKNCRFLPGSSKASMEPESRNRQEFPLTNIELLAAEYGVEPMHLPQLSPLRNFTDWQPGDSHAAKRIAANCHRLTCFGHFELMHSSLVKPSHSCEKGEFHFCKKCYDEAVHELELSNTKPVNFKTKIGGEASIQQYTCPSGYPSPEYAPAICKICHGTCTRLVINGLSSLYKTNGGSEGKLPRWNNAACPWIFNLVPGVERSYITLSWEKRRGSQPDLMEKLNAERRDEWEMLFAM